ncbi:MAG: DUF2778 domain-containing protein [Bradyrhizobium sp.]|uniref:DUF2778 domain-containing protein n=1 Tax=Bradyrhizobium sp. TaxID=376 RepID=UPI00239568F9|nr:DUF2778 domain-containing protein [Bradyrhizobium sp.]MDE2603041.1 DUF2778 domain-containing protein [Bradyrhizobium sp.]
MSTSACFEFAADTPRNFPRKAVPYRFVGSAAVACLIIGCGWTIYNNVFGASIYPSANDSNVEIAAVRRATPVIRKPVQVANSSVIVETMPVTAAPAIVPPAPSISFDERFAASAPQSVAAAPPQPERRVAALAPMPERRNADAVPMPPSRAEAKPAKASGASIHDMAQRAKSDAKAGVKTGATSVASAEEPGWKPEKPLTIFERLFGKSQSSGSSSSSALAYASADVGSTGSLGSASQNIASLGTGALYDRQTAVYDISAHIVYLPDGTKLEAHSGLGSSLDDPRSANIRMRGVTPPHLYDLKPRESLFHGVAALRLNPVGGEGAIYGRSGLLAHSFMLGPKGDSNGCVSFRDYNAFLDAYRNKGVRRLAVVAYL